MTNIENFRLPREVLPFNYEILLTPDLESWTYDGFERIDVEVLNNVNEIRLNSIELLITKVRFNEKEGKVQYITELEQAILIFDETLAPGKGTLEITFQGTLNDYMRGFYRSGYKTDDGEYVRLGVTQFEPTDARRAFPCWDEPNFKATFELKLIVLRDTVVLSNMPLIARISIWENHVKVTFEKTPPMSTYLLAFVIGEFDYIESENENSVKIRVYTTKNKQKRGKFALNVCCKIMSFYERYFNIPYPLPKLDLIAIPDFVYGAMENWGLLTFRDTSLLVDDIESSEKSRRWVAKVIAHECAHMWFGNLVTMDWWSDLWLNEGFATWLCYHAIDHCFPEYDAWSDFAVEQYSVALKLDSLKSSHPIQSHVENNRDIVSYFDSIAYSKGASLLHMLSDYITAEKFQKGLILYLKKFKFKNTTSKDIWEALEEISGEPIGDIMNSWIKQIGFPLISVKSMKDDSGHIDAVILTQKRFSIHDSCDSEQFWFVPISLYSIKNPKKLLAKVILQPNGESQIVHLSEPELDLVIINRGAVGFFRVHYEENILHELQSAIVAGKLDPIDRLDLVLNLFALAHSGTIPITSVLKFVSVYQAENNYRVLYSLVNHLKTILSLVDGMEPSLTGNVERFISDLFVPVFRQLGWDEKKDESFNDIMVRALMVFILGLVGHQDVVDESLRRFELHDPLNNKILSPDIRIAVYSTVLKQGNINHLNKMFSLLTNADFDEERRRILKSLGSVPSSSIKYVYRFTMSKAVRKLDKHIVFLSSATSATKRGFLWDFVRSNWNDVQNLVIDFSFNFFDGFSSLERYSELETYFRDYSSDLFLQQALENIHNNINVLQADGDQLRDFFSK